MNVLSASFSFVLRTHCIIENVILAQWCYIDKVRSATRSQAVKYMKLYIYENKQPYSQFIDGKPDIQQ